MQQAPSGRTLQRKQVLLVALTVTALATLIAAFVARRGPVWGAQVIADALLLSYVGLLIRFRNASAAVEMARRGLRP